MRSFSLSDKMIYSMCQDSEGGIWIGTLFGGVNYLPNRNLQFDKFVLEAPEIHQTYPGTGRRCERQYLDRYGGCGNQCTECGEWEIKQIRDNNSENHPVTLAVVPFQDQIYCGLLRPGLTLSGYRDMLSGIIPSELKIGEGSVYVFHIDKEGRKWLGTGWGALCRRARFI